MFSCFIHREHRSEERVNHELEVRMVKSFQNVLKTGEEHDVDLNWPHVLKIRRIVEAHNKVGLFP